MSDREYFNADQRGYMRSLDAMSLENRCWCGWYRRGECCNCAPHLSCADKIKEMCPVCHNAPNAPGGELTHIITCPRSKS